MSTANDATNDDPTPGESYGDYSVDDEDQPAAESFMLDDQVDEADRGYSPPEKYSAGQGFGNTPWEEARGETLDQRVAQEEPEPDPYVQAEQEDENLEDGEVGAQRAGRLVAPDQGVAEDTDRELIGTDVGIDGAAASAEEAAVHVVEGEDPGPLR